MDIEKSVEPVGFAMARKLSQEEAEKVGGGAATGTLSGKGGGNPVPIHVTPDVDGDVTF